MWKKQTHRQKAVKTYQPDCYRSRW